MKLQLNLITFCAFSLVVLLWMISAALAGGRHAWSTLKWRTIPLSFFGLAWLCFAALYIFRFLTLAYDPVLFRATQFPLWRISAAGLSRTWFFLGLYWLCFCASAAMAIGIMRGRLPRFLGKLDFLDHRVNLPVLDMLIVGTTIAVLAVFGIRLPRGIATPVGHLSSLWVLPATIAWFLHFRGHRVGARRFLYLAPGVLLFLLSPFREHLLTLFLCVFLPMLVSKRRIHLATAIAIVSVVLVGCTIALAIYRPVKWQGEKWAVSRRYVDWESWRRNPREAPWSKLSARFHGFDAAALTLYLVPALFPHQDRDVAAELLMSAFVPRALYAGKVHVQRGRIFSRTIWAYDESGSRLRRTSALIAPSMPGDLWAAGGAMMLVVGAAIWGALIGLLDCWRRLLRRGPGIALTVFLGIRVAGGIERDFVYASATLIQVLVVFLLVLVFLPLKRKGLQTRRVAPSPARAMGAS